MSYAAALQTVRAIETELREFHAVRGWVGFAPHRGTAEDHAAKAVILARLTDAEEQLKMAADESRGGEQYGAE